MFKKVKKFMHPLNNSKIASYLVTFNDDTIASVPNSEDNRYYQEILEWEKIDGNNIEDAG